MRRALLAPLLGALTIAGPAAAQQHGIDVVSWLSEGFASYFDAGVGAALDGDSVLARIMRDNAPYIPGPA